VLVSVTDTIEKKRGRLDIFNYQYPLDVRCVEQSDSDNITENVRNSLDRRGATVRRYLS